MAERGEQLLVQRHRADPLLAADDEGDPHEVVVDGVREVVGGQPRALVGRLEDHRVVAVGLVRELAPDGVGEADARARGGQVGGAEAHDVGITGRELGRDVLRCGVAPDRPRAVVAGGELGRLLAGGDVGELLLRREAGVGLPGAQELAHVGEVDLLARRLVVGPVVPEPVGFVGGQVEVGEGARELLQRPLDLARLVGVLHAHEVDAAGVGGDIAVDHRDVHAADVHEPGRRRAEPRDLGALGQLTGRVAALPLRGLGQVGGEEGVDDSTVQHDERG